MTTNFALIKGQPEVLLGFDRIERAGTRAKFDFNFPHYDQDFYVGAYGFDMAGNRGKISNLVHVRVSSPTSVYMHPKRHLKEPVLKLASKSMDPDWIIIGSICGVISVLLVMAISSITYYIYVYNKIRFTGVCGRFIVCMSFVYEQHLLLYFINKHLLRYF